MAPSAPSTHDNRSVAGRWQSAVTGLFALATVWALVAWAVQSSAGQRLDQQAMLAVVEGRDARLSVLSVLGYVSIGAVLLVAAACGLVALLRGALRLALAAGVVIAGANITTQVLKLVIDRPDFGFSTLNSLPSGHTTLAASTVAAAALVVPRAAQPLVAFGSAFAVTMVGASTVVAGWHRPSDVVAACAVTLVWTAIADLVLGTRTRPAPALALTALAGAIGSGVVLIAIGVRPHDGWAGFFEAAMVLGSLGVTVAIWSWLTTRLGG